jgi:hypothetical protein
MDEPTPKAPNPDDGGSTGVAREVVSVVVSTAVATAVAMVVEEWRPLRCLYNALRHPFVSLDLDPLPAARRW